MRIAVIVVTVAFASSPSQASPSCMTQAEARAAFGQKHLYWHGPNRCWDATPGRRQLARRIKAKEARQPARDAQVERAVPEEKPPRWTHESRWREAMSRMMPEDLAALQPPARAQASVETLDVPMPRFEMPAAPRINWRDRWVDVAQRVPLVADNGATIGLSTAAAPAEVEPMLTPARVIVALLTILLTLALVEILFRTTHRDWRREG